MLPLLRERAGVEHHADAALQAAGSGIVCMGAERLSEQKSLARIEFHQAHEGTDCRGFSGAVRADEADDAAGGEGEAFGERMGRVAPSGCFSR